MAKNPQNESVQSAEFKYDFAIDAKSFNTVEEDGDLYVEGYASDFDVDRQDEAFLDDAFNRGLKSFMESNPILCFHHDLGKALGQVVEATIDQKGLKIKARLDKPADGSWAQDVYNKVKRGTIRAFSVGGIFRRKLTEKGWRIHDVDLVEISVTPAPVNPRTTFAVVAGKAFAEQDLALETEKVPDLSEYDKAIDRIGTVISKFEVS